MWPMGATGQRTDGCTWSTVPSIGLLLTAAPSASQVRSSTMPLVCCTNINNTSTCSNMLVTKREPMSGCVGVLLVADPLVEQSCSYLQARTSYLIKSPNSPCSSTRLSPPDSPKNYPACKSASVSTSRDSRVHRQSSTQTVEYTVSVHASLTRLIH